MAKNFLREEVLRVRSRHSGADVVKKSALIKSKLFGTEAFKRAGSILAYMPIRGEVDTRNIILESVSAGKRIALPAVRAGKIFPMEFNGFESMVKGMYGILEPSGTREIASDEIELAIVPGIAFDASGNRLGYGKGFYDMFLKDFRGKKIGLAYDFQIKSVVPSSENDVKMDVVITESRIVECA